MSHTPGPWYVFPPGEFSMWHVGPAGHSVAYVRSVDDTQANTQLIAAAPDLLEACEAAFMHMVANDEFGATMNKLDRAIAKARGEK